MSDTHKLKINADDYWFDGEDAEFSIDGKSFFGLSVSRWRLEQDEMDKLPVLETEHIIMGEEVEIDVGWEPKFNLEHAPKKFKEYLYKRLEEDLKVDASEMETMYEGKYEDS